MQNAAPGSMNQIQSEQPVLDLPDSLIFKTENLLPFRAQNADIRNCIKQAEVVQQEVF